MAQDLERTLAEINVTLQPDYYYEKAKASARRQLSEFLAKISGGFFKPTVEESRLMVGSFIHVEFHHDPERIVALWQDGRGRKGDRGIKAALTYEPVKDEWVGARDEAIVPTPGQPYPLKSFDLTMAEVLLKAVKEAEAARNTIR